MKTMCARDCPDGCFMDVTIENNKIISIKGNSSHPVTQGILCLRGKADIRRVYSNKRILTPFIRNISKPGKHFYTLDWNKTISLIALKLSETLKKYGPESVLLLDYAGNTGLLSLSFTQRLWHALGATTTDHALCSASGHEALAMHYGLSYGMPVTDISQKKVIIYWGFNARVSAMHQWRLALKAKNANQAKIVVIDSRQSESASAADLWLAPRLGTDGVLGYGIAKFLIENNYIDSEFINANTIGFEEYKKEALSKSYKEIEVITGIRRNQIESLGNLIGINRQTAFMIGLGLQKNLNGAEMVRSICLLPALLGEHRGFYYTNSRGYYIDWDYLTGKSLSDKKSKIVSQVVLSEHLQSGEFKFIFIKGTNPVATLPNQKVIRKVLSGKDVFVVVHDTHWTETADFADIVLPASTFFEKNDIIISDCHPYTQLSRQIIPELGESKTEVWVMQELSKVLELQQNWLKEKPSQALGHTLKNSFVDDTVEDLMNGIVCKLKSRPKNQYQTPSGKIEFTATIASKSGMNHLPSIIEQKIDDNEFFLLTSAVPNFTHTQFQDVFGSISPYVWMHETDANILGVMNDNKVFIYNDLGSIEVYVKIKNQVAPGTIWAPKFMNDLNGNPINILTPPVKQLIGHGPVFNSTKIKIKK